MRSLLLPAPAALPVSASVWQQPRDFPGAESCPATVENCRHLDGIICGAMDARRSQVYNALFLAEQGTLTRLTEDRAVSLQDLGEELRKTEKKIFLVGDGAKLCYNTLQEQLPGLSLLPEQLRMQRASGVALSAWAMAQIGLQPNGGELAVNYLRLSQAEREKQERENKAKSE